MEGLEESINEFRTVVMGNESRINILKNFVGIGIGGTNSRRFDRVTNSIIQLECLIRNYADNICDDKLEFAVTYIHPTIRMGFKWEISEKSGLFVDSEMAVDSLRYLLPDSSYFVGLNPTDFYNKFTRRIMSLYEKLEVIRKEIFASEEYSRGVSSKVKDLDMRKIYLKKEFDKREQVIPLIQEMLDIYRIGKTLVEGIVREL